MSGEQETSPSGDAIYRYSEPEGFEVGDHTEFGEKIQDHVEQHIGPIKTVFHEILSNRVHVDVLVVAPTEERPYWTFVTCGMSARAMALPDEALGSAPLFAEVVMALPNHWQFSSGSGDILGNHPGDYPISLLRYVAHFPHNYSTWLGAGHTIPNGEPPEPIADDTLMCGCMLAPVIGVDRKFNRLSVRDNVEIGFYGVIPIHRDELDLKLQEGANVIYDLFDQKGVSELFDPSRPSVIPQQKRGFLKNLFGN